MPKQRVSINVDEDVAGILAGLSAKVGRARKGAHGRQRTSGSLYIEALIRDAQREWRLALAFLDARGYDAATLAAGAETLRDIEDPIPARMAALLSDLADLSAGVRDDPQVAAALFVVAREWWRHNPLVREALVAEEAA